MFCTSGPNLVISPSKGHKLPCGQVLGLYSLSGKTSYRQISWSLKAARLDVAMVVSLWNLTGTSAAVVPAKFQNIWKSLISRLRDFTRSCGKTSYRLVNRGPGLTHGRTETQTDPGNGNTRTPNLASCKNELWNHHQTAICCCYEKVR